MGADGARSETKEQLLEMKTRMGHIYQFRDEDGQPSMKRTDGKRQASVFSIHNIISIFKVN